MDPEKVAETCGVNAADVRRAAEIFGTEDRVLSTVLQGFYQSAHATASSCQVNNLHLLRGMLGKPGCGLLQMNGQPTAQNNRECGADGDLPGFRNWENPQHVEELARLWNVDPASSRTGPRRRTPCRFSATLNRVPSGCCGSPPRTRQCPCRSWNASGTSWTRTACSWWCRTSTSLRPRSMPTSFSPALPGARRPAPSPTLTGPSTCPRRPSIRRGRRGATSTSSSTMPAGWGSRTRTGSLCWTGPAPRTASRPGRSARAAGRATTPASAMTSSAAAVASSGRAPMASRAAQRSPKAPNGYTPTVSSPRRRSTASPSATTSSPAPPRAKPSTRQRCSPGRPGSSPSTTLRRMRNPTPSTRCATPPAGRRTTSTPAPRPAAAAGSTPQHLSRGSRCPWRTPRAPAARRGTSPG